jgi:hypothetical protein
MPGAIVCVCVFHFVRSTLRAHRSVTDIVFLIYPLSRHAFQTLPSMKRATGLSKIHGSAMNMRTYPLFNNGCLTMQSLGCVSVGIITMYHWQPLCPSLLLSKVVPRKAYQLSSPVDIKISDHTVYCNAIVMTSVNWLRMATSGAAASVRSDVEFSIKVSGMQRH